MSELDQIIAEGLGELDAICGENFTFRDVPRLGNISDAQIERIGEGGGSRKSAALVIVYNRKNGEIEGLRVGETVSARGFKLKIERLATDETSHTMQCVDFAA